MTDKIKNIHIFGGGTITHIANHLALSAPAYGRTARTLEKMCLERFDNMNVKLELTKMADLDSRLITTQDVERRVDELIADYNTKIIFFTCAICDFESKIQKGKNDYRYDSHNPPTLELKTANKIISKIRRTRKDITLIGFKTTCGASSSEMYIKGLNLCKKSSCNLVLVNDAKSRHNLIVTPEEASYHESSDRKYVLEQLVDMAYYRSHLTFTRSTVLEGTPVSWNDSRIPNSLKESVNYAINNKAYKPFNGATVGHFAIKLSDTEFLTSIRKSNFNDLEKNGMVYVKTDGPDTVLAYGAKPSVGGQSQRIIFKDHPNMDCVLHFHCPLKSDHVDDIPVVSQREVECGSHECGRNTSNNLKQFGNLKCVMLENHGPNIVFNRNIDSGEVINFIERNFDLNEKTGGYNLI